MTTQEYVPICLEGLRKTVEHLSKDTHSLKWDFNLKISKFEARVPSKHSIATFRLHFVDMLDFFEECCHNVYLNHLQRSYLASTRYSATG
jgi:hypothetical protein